MAFEHKPVPDWSMPAAADLSSAQFLFGVVDANGRVAISGAGAAGIGVIQDNDADAIDRETAIQSYGVSKVRIGAAVAAGARVASNASGQAVTAASGNVVNGIALSGGSNANEIISVLLTLGGGQVN